MGKNIAAFLLHFPIDKSAGDVV